MDVLADGAGSTIQLDALTTMTDANGTASGDVDGRWSTLVARDGGTVVVNSAATGIQGVQATAGLLGTLRGSLAIGAGARLDGLGTVTGNVTNGGLVAPKGETAPTAILTIGGSYTQTADGRLEIDLGGTTPGSQHDVLAVAGPGHPGRHARGLADQ